MKDSEITVQKYISEAERKRLKEEEEERLRLEAEANKDNSAQRALDDMMGGTLEQKRDLVSLEQELEREDWMDTLTYDEMRFRLPAL